MTLRITFTKTEIAAIPAPSDGSRVTVYDAKVPKLAVRVTASGVRTFYVVKRAAAGMVWIRLGVFPDMTVEQARKAAESTLGEFADGKNPADAKRAERAGMTLGEAFETYMTRHVAARGIKRADDLRQMWERCLGDLPDAPRKKHAPRERSKHPAGVNWQNRKLTQIKRDDVAKLHAAIGATHPTLANRVIELLSAIFNRLGQWGLSDANPATRIEPYREQKRDRFLQSVELPRFFTALAVDTSDDFRDFVTLALMTGARRSNVLAMRWADVTFERAVWSIPASESKNDEPVDVPLVPEAVAILQARKAAQSDGAGVMPLFAFPAESKSGHMTPPKKRWAQLLDRAELAELMARIAAAGAAFEWANNGTESLERAVARARAAAATMKIDTAGARLDDLRLHDLRRSLGSWQAILGASLQIVGKSLGHKSPSATAIYSRLSMDPVRASVEAATSAMLVAGGMKETATVTKARRKIGKRERPA